MAERKRLWEVDHPYYMTEGCYFARPDQGCHHNYESWRHFLEEWGDADPDMNLVFRWDWREGEDWGIPEGEAQLSVYHILQRKGVPVSCDVAVSRDDEPAIRQWLFERFKRMQMLWEPFE